MKNQEKLEVAPFFAPGKKPPESPTLLQGLLRILHEDRILWSLAMGTTIELLVGRLNVRCYHYIMILGWVIFIYIYIYHQLLKNYYIWILFNVIVRSLYPLLVLWWSVGSKSAQRECYTAVLLHLEQRNVAGSYGGTPKWMVYNTN